MKEEEIKCDRLQEEGDNCSRCGYSVGENGVCRQCETDPEKDEWKW